MSWQDERRRAHEEGRHAVPQIDCVRCYEDGRLRSPGATPEDADGLWHRGQHQRCPTCEAFRESHRPPPSLTDGA